MMTESSSGPIRRRVLFQGRVQGVGFRYTTASIARRYPVVGFVRNLPDGSVELVAEAEPTVLEQFVADIVAELAGNIRQYDARDVGFDELLNRFEIRR
ncbi:MAG: acylphosphatase [Planctomycetaceae bacterium]